jgi:hypothetical protein
MMKLIRLPLALLAALVLITSFAAAPAVARTKAGSQVFQGLVEHVSPDNVKVTDPKTKQTLSFLMVPHFGKIFKSDGKTTAQEHALREGAYVKVYYDQKALGQRHADRILILNNSNEMMKQVKG